MNEYSTSPSEVIDEASANHQESSQPLPPLNQPDTPATARSAHHPERSTDLGVVSRNQLHGGGAELKAIVNATVGDRVVSLIERPYREKDVRVWRALRGASIPTPPTLRITESEQGHRRLLFTDLKADGSELYGKGLRLALRRDSARERAPELEIDQRFLELSRPDNMPVIKQHAEAYAKRANAHRIILPSDDPFELYIRPDGSWDLLVLDYHWSDVCDSSANRETKAMSNEEVSIHNTSCVNIFVNTIGKLREEMQPTSQKRFLGRLILNRLGLRQRQ